MHMKMWDDRLSAALAQRSGLALWELLNHCHFRKSCFLALVFFFLFTNGNPTINLHSTTAIFLKIQTKDQPSNEADWSRVLGSKLEGLLSWQGIPGPTFLAFAFYPHIPHHPSATYQVMEKFIFIEIWVSYVHRVSALPPYLELWRHSFFIPSSPLCLK